MASAGRDRGAARAAKAGENTKRFFGNATVPVSRLHNGARARRSASAQASYRSVAGKCLPYRSSLGRQANAGNNFARGVVY